MSAAVFPSLLIGWAVNEESEDRRLQSRAAELRLCERLNVLRVGLNVQARDLVLTGLSDSVRLYAFPRTDCVRAIDEPNYQPADPFVITPRVARNFDPRDPQPR